MPLISFPHCAIDILSSLCHWYPFLIVPLISFPHCAIDILSLLCHWYPFLIVPLISFPYCAIDILSSLCHWYPFLIVPLISFPDCVVDIFILPFTSYPLRFLLALGWCHYIWHRAPDIFKSALKDCPTSLLLLCRIFLTQTKMSHEHREGYAFDCPEKIQIEFI